MAVATITAKATEARKEPPTIRYRFRKAWRVVLFLALIPFLQPSLIPAPSLYVRFLSGMIALVPLATFIEVVTEDLIERLGQLVGGLLHAFFGNVAFFVLTVSTLIAASNDPAKAGELVSVVQSSIAGTVVVDILFILGVSILVGGLRNGRMQFSAEYSNQYAEMITVAVIALALPSLAYALKIRVGFNSDQFFLDTNEIGILSDITAVILIIAYVGYLGWTVFKFRDMAAKPQEPVEGVSESLRGDLIGPLAEAIAPVEEAQQRAQLQHRADLMSAPTVKKAEDAAPVAPVDNSAMAAIINERLAQRSGAAKGSGAKTLAQQEATDRNRGIALWELAILVLGTGGVVFISEQMADSIRESLTVGHTISFLNPFLIGFIIVPIAANLVELSASVSTAWHDRMETCLAVTAGSAIQVMLLVAPALVLVGHILGLGSMNLVFGLFILAIFGLIAYLFQLITVDGETTWLEGLQFTSFFAVIVVIAIFAGKS